MMYMVEVDIRKLTRQFKLKNPYFLTMGITCKKCGKEGDVIEFKKEKKRDKIRCYDCGSYRTEFNRTSYGRPEWKCNACGKKWSIWTMTEIRCDCGSHDFIIDKNDKCWVKLMVEVKW